MRELQHAYKKILASTSHCTTLLTTHYYNTHNTIHILNTRSPGHDIIKWVPEHLDALDLELVDGSVPTLTPDLYLAQPQHVEDCVARHLACVRRVKSVMCATIIAMGKTTAMLMYVSVSKYLSRR